MRFLNRKTNIDFIGKRRVCAAISAVMIAVPLLLATGIVSWRHGVERTGDIGSPACEGVEAYDRYDVLGGLQLEVVGQLDKIGRIQLGRAGEHQPGIDLASAQGLGGEGQ